MPTKGAADTGARETGILTGAMVDVDFGVEVGAVGD
jgi:hypothetical protein